MEENQLCSTETVNEHENIWSLKSVRFSFYRHKLQFKPAWISAPSAGGGAQQLQ